MKSVGQSRTAPPTVEGFDRGIKPLVVVLVRGRKAGRWRKWLLPKIQPTKNGFLQKTGATKRIVFGNDSAIRVS